MFSVVVIVGVAFALSFICLVRNVYYTASLLFEADFYPTPVNPQENNIQSTVSPRIL